MVFGFPSVERYYHLAETLESGNNDQCNEQCESKETTFTVGKLGKLKDKGLKQLHITVESATQ